MELREVLRALGVSLRGEQDLVKRLSELGVQVDSSGGGIGLDHVVKILSNWSRFNRVETGRYYTALSLREAEAVRGCVHLRQDGELVTNKTASVALWMGPILLDVSAQHPPVAYYQPTQALQCFKFFNSDLSYTDQEISMLLSGIKLNDLKKRETFFQEVRSCRRRSKKPWTSSALAPVFRTQDEYTLLARRAVLAVVRLLIQVNGMRLLDAFRAFDANNDGVLMCSELYGGLTWLGMQLTPESIHEIVRHIDRTGEGRVCWNDFETALSQRTHEEKMDDNTTTSAKGSGGAWQSEIKTQGRFRRVRIPPRPMPELWVDPRTKDIKAVHDIPLNVLNEIKVKIKTASNFNFVWDSKSTKARQRVSIWRPQLEKTFKIKRNKMRICLGHYAVRSFSKPSRSKCLLIELTDTNTAMVLKSSNLDDAHLNHLVPHPMRYKRVWSQIDSNSQFHAWKPVPPNKNYVALGMVGTTSPDEPSLQEVRCLPVGWTVPATRAPVKIWDDSGTGGRRGSCWVVNSFGSAVFCHGHDPPKGPFFDLKSKRFMAIEGYKKGAHSLRPDAD